MKSCFRFKQLPKSKTLNAEVTYFVTPGPGLHFYLNFLNNLFLLFYSHLQCLFGAGVNVAGVILKELNPQMGTNADPENWNEIHNKVVMR